MEPLPRYLVGAEGKRDEQKKASVKTATARTRTGSAARHTQCMSVNSRRVAMSLEWLDLFDTTPATPGMRGTWQTSSESVLKKRTEK